MSSERSTPRIPPPRRPDGHVVRGESASAAEGFQPRRSPAPGGRRQSGSSRRSDGSGGRGRRRQRTMVRIKREWMVVLVMLVMALVTFVGLWALGRGHSGRPAASSAAIPQAQPLEKWQGPVPAVIADRFTKARTHEQRLELVRNPDEVGPAMKRFFESGPGASERVIGTVPLPHASSGDLLFESFSIQIDNAPDRLLCVSVDPGGARVDFKCYARFGSVPWQDLLSGKAEAAEELRVVLQEGGFYLREFADESRWVHFRATSPDLDETLDFYLDRGSPRAAELLEKKSSRFRATVGVRSLNGSGTKRQFEMVDIKSLDWLDAG